MKRYLNLFLFAAVALLLSCSGDRSGGKVVLASAYDSLSYASGMRVSRNLRAMAFDEMGIDSTTVELFVAGIRAAFPLNITPESKAFVYGMSLGASAMEMYEKTLSQFGRQGIDGVDRHLFIEGVVAAICDDKAAFDMHVATDYYNRRTYCAESDAFMQRNSERSGVVTLPEGLQYKIEKMGDGPKATPLGVASCIYKGYFTDGEIFETSGGQVVDIPVAETIPGLFKALTLLSAGTVCTLYVPWQLGYGPRGADGIPPYQTLVFDLEIVNVK